MGSDLDLNQFILKKMDSLENRFDVHVSKIESRLDQIVDIMRMVAALQEKETHNSDNIVQVRNALKDSVDGFNKTIERIHVRLDEIEKTHKTTDDIVKNTETRNKTIMTAALVLWTGISGVFGWMWDKSANKIDSYIEKIETLDRKMDQTMRTQESLQSEMVAIPAIKRSITSLENSVENLESDRRNNR